MSSCVAFDAGAQFPDLGRVARVHPRQLDTCGHLGEFLLQLRLVGGLVLREGVAHLRQ